MLVRTIIDYVNDIKKNRFTTDAKINWIADVDEMIADEIMPQFNDYNITPVSGQTTYEVNNFLRIVKLFVNDKQLPKIDARSNKKQGYYLNGTDQISFYPELNTGDVVRVVEKLKLARYTRDDLATPVLAPAKFNPIYSHYIMAQMAMLEDQDETYNKHIGLFNDMYSQLAVHALKEQPIDRTYKLKNLF